MLFLAAFGGFGDGEITWLWVMALGSFIKSSFLYFNNILRWLNSCITWKLRLTVLDWWLGPLPHWDLSKLTLMVAIFLVLNSMIMGVFYDRTLAHGLVASLLRVGFTISQFLSCWQSGKVLSLLGAWDTVKLFVSPIVMRLLLQATSLPRNFEPQELVECVQLMLKRD